MQKLFALVVLFSSAYLCGMREEESRETYQSLPGEEVQIIEIEGEAAGGMLAPSAPLLHNAEDGRVMPSAQTKWFHSLAKQEEMTANEKRAKIRMYEELWATGAIGGFFGGSLMILIGFLLNPGCDF